jgi:hypothetical protein
MGKKGPKSGRFWGNSVLLAQFCPKSAATGDEKAPEVIFPPFVV